jgi:hypothetical protein
LLPSSEIIISDLDINKTLKEHIEE